MNTYSKAAALFHYTTARQKAEVLQWTTYKELVAEGQQQLDTVHLLFVFKG